MVATVVMGNLKAAPTKMATTPAVLVIRLQSFERKKTNRGRQTIFWDP